MSYGTPRAKDEIETYYTDIRRGRAPSAEQLADLVRRYDAIGGLSPLNERSAEQLEALQRALEALAPHQFLVEYGTKHASPSIEDAIDRLASAGVQAIAGVVLAPHYSALSVGDYIARATEVATAHRLEARFVSSWATEPALIDALARRIERASSEFAGDHVEVIVSAHSLPERVVSMKDPYPGELASTARALGVALSRDDLRIAYQSAGRTPEPWLGPDVNEVIEEIAQNGARALVVCPAGFTADHLEVLYDLDIEARAHAARLGLGFARTESINAEPAVFDALARRVLELY
jgi:ferrochelatase